MSSILRTFIALNPPSSWREQCERVQNETRRALASVLAREQLRALRWVAPENIHLTLLFLGDVKAEHVAAIGQLIRHAIADIATFELQTGDFGFFPPKGAPRVLWIGFKEFEPLTKLHANLARELMAQREVLCPNSDARSFKSGGFSPHLTLARIKSSDRSLAPSLHAVLEKVPIKISSPWKVEGIDLIRSELSSQGSKYSVLENFGLRAQ